MTLSSTSHTPYTHVPTSLHDRADIQREQVTMVMAYPKASHQIIIFSPDLAMQPVVQPTPPCSQTGLIKRLDADLVSPGSRSRLTESQT
eukprot:superscaffoldBa00002303_g13847